jgi:hypothetical protein
MEENADLKCKLVEAESLLVEERMLKECKCLFCQIVLVKLEKRIESQQQEVKAQWWEYRASFEERINAEREKNHRLSQEKITLEEKIKRFQIQLNVALETRDHLEKEN